ncbi:MAG TPA: uroporphyrinogen-III C-methyltransferase [Opitutae bacterium]|nr:uroporphyrinogen-III C-methyltransferase [Opitutae bacterium]|tara:strand:+ start:2583 stop:4133 length:1551 start_codon:yes stop_codon:yes gene_type:complete
MLGPEITHTGKVYLVGAGPGDIGLVTVKGRDLLATCDLIVYDNLFNSSLLGYAGVGCELVDVGKIPGRHTLDQAEINQILVEQARSGKTIVRLKGGDPSVFGRCGEEMTALDAAGVSYELVPGVTAALGCAAYAGIPLTDRDYGSSISFLTGHEDVEKESLRINFGKFAAAGGTLCVYMGMGKLEEIVEKLIAGGLSGDKPSAIVSNGTLPTQRKVLGPLGELVDLARSEGLESPAVIFVGNAVGLAGKNQWFEERPFFGRRFVVTRPKGQSSSLKGMLENLGAEVLELPLIRILPSEDRNLVTEAFAGIATYEWIVFTSANGAREFFRLFFKAFEDIRSFGPMRVACVGEATAAIVRSYNLQVELVPLVSTAEDLARSLIASDSLDSANVLVVTGNRNREVLVELLETVGRAIVDTFPVYGTDFADVVEARNLPDFLRRGADAVIFNSSSAALSYVEQEEDLKLEDGATEPLLCSMGPQTSKTLRENGLKVGIEAETPSLEAVVDCLLKKFGRSS